MWDWVGESRFSVEFVLSQSTETFGRGNFQCFRRFLASKFFQDKKIKECLSWFSVGIVLSHSTKAFPRGTFLCFGNFLVSRDDFSDKRGGLVVEFHTFLSSLFCFRVPKPFVEEAFSVIDSLQYRKCLRIGGNRAPFESFRRNCFVSVYWHISFSNRSVFEIVSRIEKCLGYGHGTYHGFPSRLICLTVPNHFVEERFCNSEIFLCRKVLWIRRDGAPIESFRRNCFVSQYQNNSQRSPSVFLKVYRTGKFQRQDEKGRLSRVSVEIVVSQCNETFL